MGCFYGTYLDIPCWVGMTIHCSLVLRHPVEQIKRVVEDNLGIIFVISP